jgi:hypothetical protein
VTGYKADRSHSRMVVAVLEPFDRNEVALGQFVEEHNAPSLLNEETTGGPVPGALRRLDENVSAPSGYESEGQRARSTDVDRATVVSNCCDERIAERVGLEQGVRTDKNIRFS